MEDKKRLERLQKDIPMQKILIAFSQKYDGDFNSILEALKTKEKLSKNEIVTYNEDVEENVTTIISEDYPFALQLIPSPPVVLYYDGNIELMSKYGMQFNYSRSGCDLSKRCFIAVRETKGIMDYCIGTENEKDLQAVKERMIELNPQIKFSDYSNDQYLKNEMVR